MVVQDRHWNNQMYHIGMNLIDHTRSKCSIHINHRWISISDRIVHCKLMAGMRLFSYNLQNNSFNLLAKTSMKRGVFNKNSVHHNFQLCLIRIMGQNQCSVENQGRIGLITDNFLEIQGNIMKPLWLNKVTWITTPI